MWGALRNLALTVNVSVVLLENHVNKQDKGEKHVFCQPELPDANVSVHTGHATVNIKLAGR